jgi:hypothetical protein
VKLSEEKKMGRKGLGAALAMVAVLLFPGVSHALTHNQKALVGLRGVNVIVENISPKAENLGLTAEQIKTDVELRLRKAGVRVLTAKERLAIPGMPYLYVNVSIAFSRDSTLVSYAALVALREWVTLANGFETDAAIWNTGMVGGCGINHIREIRIDVGDQVDKFINDYLAANPKR